MKKLKILVTAASGNLGRSMIYYLNKFPFQIIAADADAEFLCAPKSHKRYIVPRAESPGYIKAINKICVKENVDIIIFQSDQEIRVAASQINKIKAKVWLPDYQTLITMQDKYACNQIWAKHGLPVPRSEIVHKPNQLRKNVWLRPLGYVGGGGKLSFHAHSRQQAIEWIKLNRGWSAFTMNEFLPGTVYGFDSLWRRGKLIGYALKERINFKKDSASGNRGGPSTSVARSSDNQTVIKTCLAALRSICSEPDGIFSVDLRENVRGVPCLTEINPGRFLTTSLLMFRESSYDLPLDYIHLMLNKSIKKRPRLQEGLYLFYVTGLTRLARERDMKINSL